MTTIDFLAIAVVRHVSHISKNKVCFYHISSSILYCGWQILPAEAISIIFPQIFIKNVIYNNHRIIYYEILWLDANYLHADIVKSVLTSCGHTYFTVTCDQSTLTTLQRPLK